ncbi:MAG: Crp/Fnr family transcriptional regulator [Elusimicrobiota bacterium]
MKRKGLGLADPRVYCKGCPVLQTGFFGALNSESKAALTCMMEYGHYIPRQILYQEGNPATRIYAVKTGYVKTYRTHPLGKHQVIQIAKGGDVLNLESVHGRQCTVTAEVLTNSEICFLEVRQLMERAKRSGALAMEIIQILAAAIVDSQQRILDFGTLDAKARFAGFLLDMLPEEAVAAAASGGPRRGGKEAGFRLPLTRHEIADLIGVRLETISRLFQLFKEKKIIAADCRQVRVLNAGKLAELAK